MLGGVVGRHSRPVLVLQVVLGTFGRRKGRLAFGQKEFADCFPGGRRKDAACRSGVVFCGRAHLRSNETLSGERVSFGSELTVDR